MRKEDLILLKQTDIRWRNEPYSIKDDKHQTIGSSGSGPAASATVVATLKNREITPVDTAQIALEYGDRTYLSGTRWTHFYHIANWFGFSKFVQSKNIKDLIDCLESGGLAVCSMKGDSFWFRVPNYIVAYDYDGENIFGVYLQYKNPYRHQSVDGFAADSRQYFCFYP